MKRLLHLVVEKEHIINTKKTDLEHVFIVGSYFHYTGMFKPPSAVEVGPNPSWFGGQSQNVAYLSVVRATVDK